MLLLLLLFRIEAIEVNNTARILSKLSTLVYHITWYVPGVGAHHPGRSWRLVVVVLLLLLQVVVVKGVRQDLVASGVGYGGLRLCPSL